MKTSQADELFGRQTDILTEDAQELPLAQAGLFCHPGGTDIALQRVAGGNGFLQTGVVHVLMMRQMSRKEGVYQAGYRFGVGGRFEDPVALLQSLVAVFGSGENGIAQLLQVNAQEGVQPTGLEVQQHAFKPTAKGGQFHGLAVRTQYRQSVGKRTVEVGRHIAHEYQTAVVGQ